MIVVLGPDYLVSLSSLYWQTVGGWVGGVFCFTFEFILADCGWGYLVSLSSLYWQTVGWGQGGGG